MVEGIDATKLGLDFIKKIDDFCGHRQRWIVKLEGESTDSRYGWVPTERPINKYLEYGVINLDKPPGPTSHEVVAWIKRMFNISKAGHGGTLELRAGKPPSDRGSANSITENDKSHRKCRTFNEGVCLCHAASQACK